MEPNIILEKDYNLIKNCKHGLMLFNKNDTIIGRSLRQYGEYCEGELDLLARYVDDKSIVIDVGANIGTHTLFFSKHAKAVFAFEPQKFAFQYLMANVAINSATNVTCAEAAVGAAAGQAIAPIVSPTHEQNMGGVNLKIASRGRLVPLVALDDYQFKRCDLIKIDVEGMEEEVIKGAERTIKQNKPIIYMECNSPECSTPLIQFLENQGYRCYWHKVPYFTAKNYYQNNENIFRDLEPSSMILCLPKGKIPVERLEPASSRNRRS